MIPIACLRKSSDWVCSCLQRASSVKRNLFCDVNEYHAKSPSNICAYTSCIHAYERHESRDGCHCLGDRDDHCVRPSTKTKEVVRKGLASPLIPTNLSKSLRIAPRAGGGRPHRTLKNHIDTTRAPSHLQHRSTGVGVKTTLTMRGSPIAR